MSVKARLFSSSYTVTRANYFSRTGLFLCCSYGSRIL